MINYQDAENALNYMVGTDEEYAKAKTLSDALHEQKKTIQAVEFLKATGSAAERTQKALASEVYQDHLKKIESAQMDFEILRNRRTSQVSVIEMWRSINSAQKKGNI
ncbi:MAG: hypothetical protein P8J14_06470 [Emcibacteraceae bacterium]|nr:hypothetical protein [Emcibacteraceae bacterium]